MNSPHADFIIAAYAVTALIVAGMVLRIVLEHRALERALARLGARPDASGQGADGRGADGRDTEGQAIDGHG